MNDWSMLKKLIWLHIVKGGGGIERTVKGAIVHVINALARPAISVKCEANPIQDLHGYDSPWPAGGGKNKLQITATTQTKYGTTFTVLADGTVRISGTPTEQARLVLSSAVFSGMGRMIASTSTLPSGVRIYCRRNDGGTYTYPSFGATFNMNTDTATFDQLALEVNTTFNGTASDIRVQVESGTSASAWTPYSNICPISGRTSATVTRTGANVWDEQWELGTYNVNTGSDIPKTDQIRCIDFIPVKPLETYYLTASLNMWILFYDSNKQLLNPSLGEEWQIAGCARKAYSGARGLLTIPYNVHFLKFYMTIDYGTTYNNDISINYPSTDTAYHAYTGNTYTIQLGDTVYGGQIDVTAGKMVVDMAMVDLGTLSWNKDGNRIGNYYTSNITATPAPKMIGFAVACSQYAVNNLANANTIQNGEISSFNSYGQPRVFIKDIAKADLTGEQFTTAMSGVQLVYELATPIEITLTPTQIDMLLGENNLWADAGDLTLTYYADGNASTSEALGILLGGTYNNPGSADDVSDDEALEILLGGS